MEQPIFIKALGDTPKIRILNYLIKYRGLDYSMSDIARNSNVGWATLSRLWKEFVGLKIMTATREVGKAKLFKLNEKNEAVMKLIEVYNKLLEQETEDYFAKNTTTVKSTVE
ncbi:helix-turn-helix transcriptional regulator [Candidatus Woesearchaeota archaeon]|nr:helix-turn-helix transcriptional regulator [Candidatus Woesearchaeota archaeon]